MAPYPTGTCANCTNHGVLKYARRTMCTRYKCQKAATAEREKRLADGGGDDAVVPTYCFEIKEVIGMRFADPERLVGKKRRNELAAAETSLCYLTRGKFGEAQNDDGFIDTRWVELEELYDNCGEQSVRHLLLLFASCRPQSNLADDPRPLPLLRLASSRSLAAVSLHRQASTAALLRRQQRLGRL